MPIGGWSQSYANTNGTSFLFAGRGKDEFRVVRLDGYGEGYQARSVLAAANTSGLAALLNSAGHDKYDAVAESIAYGDAGVAIFVDGDDADEYLCPARTCYGYAIADGRGLFRDYGSDGDQFADGEDHRTPSARSNLGLAVQEGES